MSKEVEVEALKPFGRTPQGDMIHPGDPPFMVGETRAAELEASGLARRTGKVAPSPANKMAPAADTKADPAATPPITVNRRTAAAKRSGQG